MHAASTKICLAAQSLQDPQSLPWQSMLLKANVDLGDLSKGVWFMMAGCGKRFLLGRWRMPLHRTRPLFLLEVVLGTNQCDFPLRCVVPLGPRVFLIVLSNRMLWLRVAGEEQ